MAEPRGGGFILGGRWGATYGATDMQRVVFLGGGWRYLWGTQYENVMLPAARGATYGATNTRRVLSVVDDATYGVTNARWCHSGRPTTQTLSVNARGRF
eukprot:1980293-Pyramimonas_sp.AAC.1